MWFLLAVASASQPPAEPSSPPAPPPPEPAAPTAATPTPAPVMDITFASDRVVSRVLPRFPDEAVAQGVRVGGCEMRFYVDEAGVPTRVLPVNCDAVFVDAATTAGLQWRFRPYLVEGVPQKTKFNMLFVFEYQGRPVPPPTP